MGAAASGAWATVTACCCGDLTSAQKRKQFERSAPVLLSTLVTTENMKKRKMAIFIAELIEAVHGGGLEMDHAMAMRFVEKCIALTCRKFEENPLIGAPVEDWLQEIGVPQQKSARQLMLEKKMKKKKKKKNIKPEAKLELAWYEALDLLRLRFLPDRRRTNLIANWMLFDRDASGDLDVGELRFLLHALNFDDATVVFVLGRVAQLRKLSVNFFEFDAIFEKLLQFPELQECWDHVAGWRLIGGEDDTIKPANTVAAVPSFSSSGDDDDENSDDSRSSDSSSDGWEGSGPAAQQQQQQEHEQRAGSIPRATSLSARSSAARGAGGASKRRSKRTEHHAVSVEEFAKFLVDVQKENPATALDLAKSMQGKLGGQLDQSAIMRYLTSPEINCAWDIEKAATVTHDMRQPLSAYFISSSHNTYLTGNQLSSNSSAEMYARCMREGCRSVEIDCWGAHGKNVEVYHGYTRTSRIPFESVIRALNDTAFAYGNPYPVTISFELHVTVEQQDNIVDIMERIMGDRLAKPTWEPGKKPPHTVSPFLYKNKFLVKSARLYPKTEELLRREAQRAQARLDVERYEQQQDRDRERQEAEDKERSKSQLSDRERKQQERFAALDGIKLPPVPKKSQIISASAARYIALQRAGGAPADAAASGKDGKKGKKGGGAALVAGHNRSGDNGDDESAESSSDDEGDANEKRQYLRALQALQADPLQEIKKVKSKISERLSAYVIVEARRIHHLSEEVFTSTIAPQPQHCHITSFSENRSRKMLRTQFELYQKLCRRQLARIYPHAARFDSSNFHPQEHWNAGAQMVAINWQDDSYIARYAKARFALDNGNCGYLLKPPSMRGAASGESKESVTAGPVTAQSPGVMLSLRILSAFALPKPEGASAASEIIDPYCLAFVEGPFQAGTARQAKTAVIDDNGFHPVWKGSGTETSAWRIPVPEMSTLVVQVYDEDLSGDDFIAEAFIPIDRMRSGFRVVSLMDGKGRALPNAFLLLQILAEDQRTGKPLDATGEAIRKLNGTPSETAARSVSSSAQRLQAATAAAAASCTESGKLKTINLTDLREIEQVVTAENNNSPRQTAEWIDDTLRRQQMVLQQKRRDHPTAHTNHRNNVDDDGNDDMLLDSRAPSVMSPESRGPSSMVSGASPSVAAARSSGTSSRSHHQHRHHQAAAPHAAVQDRFEEEMSTGVCQPAARRQIEHGRDFGAIARAIDDLFTSDGGFSSLKQQKHLQQQQEQERVVGRSVAPPQQAQPTKKVKQIVTSRVTRLVVPAAPVAQGASSNARRSVGDDVSMPLLSNQVSEPQQSSTTPSLQRSVGRKSGQVVSSSGVEVASSPAGQQKQQQQRQRQQLLDPTSASASSRASAGPKRSAPHHQDPRNSML